MTYLATEMLLYLLATTVIGLLLGWFIWGFGQRRQIGEMRNDLLLMVEDERKEHQATRSLLRDAKANVDQAVAEAKQEADATIAELQGKIGAERQALKEAHAGLAQMREKLDQAIRTGQAVQGESSLRVSQEVEIEKARAAQAVANEAKMMAQLEELRLTIGAEKLIAENARSELEKLRNESQTALESEQAAHREAKAALEDIRSTLSRTLGPSAAMLGSGGADQTGEGRLPLAAGLSDNDVAAFAVPGMTVVNDALNDPDLDEADIEDREDGNLDLSMAIDADIPTEKVIDAIDPASRFMPGTHDASSFETQPEKGQRPSFLHVHRPGQIDTLRAISDISPEIEKRLHEAGCYHFSQLAAMTSGHIDWLSSVIDVPSERIIAERWVEQASRLQHEEEAEGSVIQARMGSSDETKAAS